MATALAKKSASQPGLAQLLTLVLLIVRLVSLPACNQAHNSPSNSLALPHKLRGVAARMKVLLWRYGKADLLQRNDKKI